MEALTNNAWKGNVRELANFIERAVILSRGEELEVPMDELRPLTPALFLSGRQLPGRRADGNH